MLGSRTDTWNRQVGFQLVNVTISVRVNKIDDGVHIDLRDAVQSTADKQP